MALIAVDTNILLYALDRKAGSKCDRAREVLRTAGYGRLRLPLQVAGEAFSILTTKFGWKKRQARAAIVAYMELISLIAATPDCVRNALNLCADHTINYWDSLLVTTAAAAGCRTLLSEDFQDGDRFEQDAGRGLQIVNPFNDKNRPILTALELVVDV